MNENWLETESAYRNMHKIYLFGAMGHCFISPT